MRPWLRLRPITEKWWWVQPPHDAGWKNWYRVNITPTKIGFLKKVKYLYVQSSSPHWAVKAVPKDMKLPQGYVVHTGKKCLWKNIPRGAMCMSVTGRIYVGKKRNRVLEYRFKLRKKHQEK